MSVDVISWVDADGTVTQLNDAADTEVGWEVQGRGMPPIRIRSDEVAEQDGSRLRLVRYGTREVSIPLDVFTASPSALRTAVRTLERLFDPKRGDGSLRVLSPDGSTRDLVCRYVGGLELQEAYEGAFGVQRTVLVFRAFDPLWRDASTTSVTFAPDTATAFFPILPLRLSSSEVYSDASIDNSGDAEAWPMWTITGPGDSPVLRNLTTDEVIDLTGLTLGAGESVVIDTAPGAKTVRSGTGSNLFSSLSSTSTLWSLAQGINSVRVELSGVTAATSVVLSYRRRWLGA